jgi:hypothetical protein
MQLLKTGRHQLAEDERQQYDHQDEREEREQGKDIHGDNSAGPSSELKTNQVVLSRMLRIEVNTPGRLGRIICGWSFAWNPQNTGVVRNMKSPSRPRDLAGIFHPATLPHETVAPTSDLCRY